MRQSVADAEEATVASASAASFVSTPTDAFTPLKKAAPKSFCNAGLRAIKLANNERVRLAANGLHSATDRFVSDSTASSFNIAQVEGRPCTQSIAACNELRVGISLTYPFCKKKSLNVDIKFQTRTVSS